MEDEAIEITFSAEQLALIEAVAAARGCTIPDFIVHEALARAREVLGLSTTRSDEDDAGAQLSAHDG